MRRRRTELAPEAELLLDQCKSAVLKLSADGVPLQDAILMAMQSDVGIGNDCCLENRAQSLILRTVFEELIHFQPEGNVSVEKKSTGSYYTPDYIVRHIVRESLAPALERVRSDESTQGDAATRLEAYLGIFVLDAAAGSGRFLSVAAQEIGGAICKDDSIAGAVSEDEALKLAVERCVFGIDISPLAVEAAVTTLFLEAAGDDGTVSALRRHISVGNALMSDRNDCSVQFPDAYQRERPGFDAVVGNPPWISFSGRHAVRSDKELLKYLYSRWDSMRGWPSAHGAFLHLATELCREGGRVGQIVPEQILDLKRYARAREALFENCELAAPPLDVDERAFARVISPSCVLILEKSGRRDRELSKKPIQVSGRLTPQGVEHCHGLHAVERAVMVKMEAFPPLPPEAFGDPGVHTGNCADLLIRKTPEEGTVPLQVGRDVTRYCVGEPRLWLVAEPERREGDYYRIADQSVYDRVKILIRQTAPYPIAARRVSPMPFRNSLLACYGAEGFSTEYLLAVLNSELMAFFHYHEFRDGRQKSFPQVKVYHLRSLPVPMPWEADPGLVAELEDLVVQMEELVADETIEAIGMVDMQIDALVRALYGVTEEEWGKVRAVHSRR